MEDSSSLPSIPQIDQHMQIIPLLYIKDGNFFNFAFMDTQQTGNIHECLHP